MCFIIIKNTSLIILKYLYSFKSLMEKLIYDDKPKIVRKRMLSINNFKILPWGYCPLYPHLNTPLTIIDFLEII